MADQDAEYPTYSEDLWDSVAFMATPTPDRQDRDQLVQQAAIEPGRQRYVHIWDYFFGLDRERVGLPLREERARRAGSLQALRQQVAATVAEATAAMDTTSLELQRFESEQEVRTAELEGRVLAEYLSKTWKLMIVGGGLLLPALLGWWMLESEGWSPGAFLLLLVGAPAAIAGLVVVLRTVPKLFPAARRQAVARGSAEFHAAWRQRRRTMQQAIDGHQTRKAEVEALLEAQAPIEEARIAVLDDHLQRLLAQLPPPVDPGQIEQWLQEELTAFREQAMERSHLRASDLQALDGAETGVLCIWGPAHLQQAGLVPPSYQPGRERHLHLQSHRFPAAPDGRFYEHYGVYNLQYFLFAKDTLATYNVFVDFIHGRALGEHHRTLYYVDVTEIQSKVAFTVVNGVEVSAPSLSLAVPGTERNIEIAFAGDEYLRLIGGIEKGRRRNYDPETIANSARRNVAHRIEAAKGRRDRSD